MDVNELEELDKHKPEHEHRSGAWGDLDANNRISMPDVDHNP